MTSSVVIVLDLELRRAGEYLVTNRPALADPLPFFFAGDAFLVMDDILNLRSIIIIQHHVENLMPDPRYFMFRLVSGTPCEKW